jgi:hypothetical protein
MEDDDIIPYRPSSTLSVDQAVMYILGYRGDYQYEVDDENFSFTLSDYTTNLQVEADSAYSIANHELEMLKRSGDATPEEIQAAEERVASAKAELERANKLPGRAENYRLLINHEIYRVRLGKRSSLVIDEDASGRARHPRILTASFLEWLGEMDLTEDTSNYEPLPLPVDEEDFRRVIKGNNAESLHFTLGLLVSLFAESSDTKFGTGNKPNISGIAKAIFEHSKNLNDGHPFEGQGTERIKDRIETGKRAFELYAFGEDLAKKYQR